MWTEISDAAMDDLDHTTYLELAERERRVAMTAQLVLPGETLPIPSSSNITLGPGVAASPASSSSAPTFISTKLGLLQSTQGKASSKGKERGSAYWVESDSKRVGPSTLNLRGWGVS